MKILAEWAALPGALLAVVVFAGRAGAEPAVGGGEGKRVALVVGNSAYKNIGELRNPRNDATAFAGALRKVEPKFTVLTAFDVAYPDFAAALDAFDASLEGAEVALFYFAGHSMQIGSATTAGSENYLLGVDAALDSLQDKPLSETSAGEQLKAMRLGAFMARMEQRARTKIVFLDACRDNPLAQLYSKTQSPAGNPQAGAPSATGATVTRSLGRGLAHVRGSNDLGGSYIAFATAPGEVAQDGEKGNSPFTAALVRHMAMRSADIEQVIMLVRRDVREETARLDPNHAQVPWSNTSLSDNFYFWAAPRKNAKAEASAPVKRTARQLPSTTSRRRERAAPRPKRSGGSERSGMSISPSLGGVGASVGF